MGNNISDLVSENTNLVYSLANRFGEYASKEDLFQVGIIGLIHASRNFDSNRGTKFSTYAYPYILGEMKKYVREDKVVRISRDIVYLASRIERAKELIIQRLKREPTTLELATFLEMDESKVIEALQATIAVRSIDEPISTEGKELTMQELISRNKLFDDTDILAFMEEFNELSELEKEVLKRRYIDGMTQSDIAEVMGISQVQVSRQEHKILVRLRGNFHN